MSAQQPIKERTHLPPIDPEASLKAWEKAAEHKPVKIAPRVYEQSRKESK